MDYNSSTDLQIKHTQIANRCVIGLRRKQSITPAYLLDLCCPTPGTRDCSSLRSMERGFLFVPIARTSTSQVRAFTGGWPLCMEWASFAQRLLPRVFSNIFCSSMKTILFSCARVGKASEQ